MTESWEKVLIMMPSTIRLSTPEASIHLTNIVRAMPDIIAGRTSLVEHVHTLVARGNDISGPPP